MRNYRVLIVLLVVVVICWGTLALAKPPGGGITHNCNIVSCAPCPEGYVLAKPVWPNCCVCVPAP